MKFKDIIALLPDSYKIDTSFLSTLEATSDKDMPKSIYIGAKNNDDLDPVCDIIVTSEILESNGYPNNIRMKEILKIMIERGFLKEKSKLSNDEKLAELINQFEEIRYICWISDFYYSLNEIKKNFNKIQDINDKLIVPSNDSQIYLYYSYDHEEHEFALTSSPIYTDTVYFTLEDLTSGKVDKFDFTKELKDVKNIKNIKKEIDEWARHLSRQALYCDNEGDVTLFIWKEDFNRLLKYEDIKEHISPFHLVDYDEWADYEYNEDYTPYSFDELCSELEAEDLYCAYLDLLDNDIGALLDEALRKDDNSIWFTTQCAT